MQRVAGQSRERNAVFDASRFCACLCVQSGQDEEMIFWIRFHGGGCNGTEEDGEGKKDRGDIAIPTC